MKKLLLIPALIAGAISANAQSDMSSSSSSSAWTPRFGVKGGYSLTNISTSSNGDVNTANNRSSWHVGVYADMPIVPMFSIQPALLLTSKGSKYIVGDKESGNYTEYKSQPLYLELPVDAVVKIPVTNDFKVIVGAGPYIAYGIGGKNKFTAMSNGSGVEQSSSITYGNDDLNSNGNPYSGQLKRWDFGLNGMAGVELGKRVDVTAGYDLGLIDVRPGASSNDNGSFKNRTFMVSLGLKM